MILAKIDEDRFLDLASHAPLIAFQKLEFGYAVAAPGEAYYAPLTHPGGGNLMEAGWTFVDALGGRFLKRMSMPALRTLRPTAKPIPTQALVDYLRTAFGASPEAMSNYDKAAGDHPAVVESECQIVILAIEENERPDLREALKPLKRAMMSNALDLVIEHAEQARDFCEVDEIKPQLIRLHLMQSVQAMKTALEMLLKP